MVLGKDSSILGYPGEVSKPLDADHHGVCKFDSMSDPRYITVRNALLSVITKAVGKATTSKSQRRYFKLFDYMLWQLG